MVPVEAIFTTHRELIGEVASGSDGILFHVRWQTFSLSVHMIADLCYPGNSIHLRGSTLKKAWYKALSTCFLTN